MAKKSALPDKHAYCYYLNIDKGPQIYIAVDPYQGLSQLFISHDIKFTRKCPELVDKVTKFLELKIKYFNSII